MSSLRDYVREIRQGKTQTSHSCIPAIVDYDAYGYAKSIFNSIVSINRDINKISVIDPYFLPEDLYIVTEFFGGYRHISLEIISKFDSTEMEKPKSERETILKNRSRQVCENGLFAGITFIHPSEKMHDRYFIFWHDRIVKLVISVGGSLAQRFQDYIFVSEVNDKYYENCIIQYHGLLCSSILRQF